MDKYEQLRALLRSPGWRAAKEFLRSRRETLLEGLTQVSGEHLAASQAEIVELDRFLKGCDPCGHTAFEIEVLNWAEETDRNG
jgi:hypothetical protein